MSVQQSHSASKSFLATPTSPQENDSGMKRLHGLKKTPPLTMVWKNDMEQEYRLLSAHNKKSETRDIRRTSLDDAEESKICVGEGPMKKRKKPRYCQRLLHGLHTKEGGTKNRYVAMWRSDIISQQADETPTGEKSASCRSWEKSRSLGHKEKDKADLRSAHLPVPAAAAAP